uniref:tRNA methyltransferase 2 homolog A n=1 Tax=Hucho hucho TaxID=62062 RepID=A0A4W5MLU7_9TELE
KAEINNSLYYYSDFTFLKENVQLRPSGPLRSSKNEERDKAMKMVHSLQWKGWVLTVHLAKPKADPILKKRGRDDPEEDAAPLSVQIATKQEVEGVLQRLVRYRDMYKPMVYKWAKKRPLEDIHPCPSQRNKCEFVIGIGANGEDKTICFRLGKYKGGSCAMVGPSDSIHVTTKAKRVVCDQLLLLLTHHLVFVYLHGTTPYSVYRPEAYEVHWKLQNSEDHNKDQAGPGGGIMFSSLRQSPNPEDLPCELVAGEECIHEVLLGLEFRISPYYFFQLSIPWAAEVLYSAVGEWAQLDKDSTVLHYAYFTLLTLSFCFLQRVRKVIGIEMFLETVKDTKVNAKINGKRYNQIGAWQLVTGISPNVTAIVDLPRVGLRMFKKILESFWRSEHVKRLVYVACDDKAAMNNFIDGTPFRPVQAMDLFPQTTHCEMLLLFEMYSTPESTR